MTHGDARPTEATPPDADTLTRFTDDLRALRLAARNPTLVALSSQTGISKSVIAEAFAGRRLPTVNTVQQLSEVLGGDTAVWVERRSTLAQRATGDRGAPAVPAAAAPARRQVPLVTAVIAAVGAALVGAGLVGGAWALTGATAGERTASAYTPYADGVDPMTTVCRKDAVLAAAESRHGEDYLVEMMYSNDCMAVCGRVTRYDGKSAGNELSMRIYPKGAPDDTRAQERRVEDVNAIYTPMLIEPDVEARVCGLATITVDGETLELAPELCI